MAVNITASSPQDMSSQNGMVIASNIIFETANAVQATKFRTAEEGEMTQERARAEPFQLTDDEIGAIATALKKVQPSALHS